MIRRGREREKKKDTQGNINNKDRKREIKTSLNKERKNKVRERE